MNFYEVLGVDEEADRSEIKRAYREKVRRFHPDVNHHPRAGEQFAVITRARDVLTAPEERNAYDRLGHANYVDNRLDGKLQDPEMTPQPEKGSEGGWSETSPGTTDTDAGRSDGTAASGAGSGTDSSGSRPRSNQSGESSLSGESTDDGAADPETTSGRASAGSGADGGTGPTSGRAGGDGTDGGPATSTPPTPGAAGRRDGAANGAASTSTDTTPETAEGRRSERATTGHLAVSRRWLGVAATAGVYFAGLAGYLQDSEAGLDALAAALTAGDPGRFAAALGSARYDVPTAVAYTAEAGLLGGAVPAAGYLLLVGTIALPVALGAAVFGLRRETTWRPSWLHVVGGLGPAVSVGVTVAGTQYPGTVPVAALPLLVDLAVLVAFPGAVIGSFLLNRLLLVMPLRRRDELGRR